MSTGVFGALPLVLVEGIGVASSLRLLDRIPELRD
jgi:hypothetical protein